MQVRDLFALVPAVLFSALVGTFVIAPFYFYAARKVDQKRLLVVTGVVAMALVGCIIIVASAIGVGSTDAAAFRGALTLIVLTPLAAGWITSAFLYWLYTILAQPYTKRPASKNGPL